MPVRVKDAPRMEIEISDWRFLTKELRKIEPKVMSRFKREARRIGKPVENAIKKAIPNKIDITGMKPKVVPGRMAWGAGVSPRKTSMKIDTKSYKRKNNSIVAIWAWSPALAMLDMANKPNMKKRFTRVYDYSLSPTGRRRHRINGQGRGLLEAAGASQKLQRANQPSRIIWPAAGKAIPAVNAEMTNLIESESRRISAAMRRK